MGKSSIWTKDFIAICLSSFFLFMNFYTLATTLPVFVIDHFHGSQQQIGLVLTVYVIAAVLLRPLAGRWADRFGKKKIAVVSLALFLACTVMYFGARSLPLLLVLRTLHGGSYGMASTAAGAVAADLVPASRKGEGIGYYSMFMSLAMVVGPFVGLTVTAHSSFTVLFAMCCAFSLLSLLCGAWMRQPRGEPAVKQSDAGAGGLRLGNLIEPGALPVSLAGLVLAFSYSSLTAFISVYAKELGFEHAASYFFICFAAMIVLPRPFIGKIFDKFGEHVLVYPGVLLFIAGMMLLSHAHSAALFLCSGAVIGLGHGAIIPCFQTLAVKASPSHRSGLATGTFFLLFDLGYGLGCYVLGVVAEHTHYHTMYTISGALAFFTAIIYYILHHRKQIAPPALPKRSVMNR
ncbi:MFS transporter [Gordoniibacillus kamchatkensis]|uniref:MFS transporter n=1 Tax=Gordoniibacillus kamchatkensis TaxID=1590651 RepID=UPI00373AEEC8